MAWTEQQIQAVWEKGQTAPPNNPNEWRKDQCGAWIGRNYYGNRNSEYGWEIDHITPVANDGSDNLSNLRPLQWQNNCKTSDGRLKCAVKANGVHNAAV